MNMVEGWSSVLDMISESPVPYSHITNMFQDERFVKHVVEMSDSRVLRELVRVSLRSSDMRKRERAWTLIEILIDSGDSKYRLLASCAFYGHLVFLEKFCERGWHDGCEGSWNTIVENAVEGGQMCVLSWLGLDLGYIRPTHVDKSRVDETYDLSVSWSITNDDVRVFEFLMNNTNNFGVSTRDPRVTCYEAVIEWAPNILDYLCETIGVGIVKQEVEDVMGSDEFEFEEAAVKWLEQRKSVDSSVVKQVMSLIDDVRDTLPDGHYLKISDLLLSIYKNS